MKTKEFERLWNLMTPEMKKRKRIEAWDHSDRQKKFAVSKYENLFCNAIMRHQIIEI